LAAENNKAIHLLVNSISYPATELPDSKFDSDVDDQMQKPALLAVEHSAECNVRLLSGLNVHLWAKRASYYSTFILPV